MAFDAPQAVEDEGELAAPQLGRDVAGELDHAVAPPEEQRDVLRREVVSELTVLLRARDEFATSGRSRLPHLLRARAAVLVRLDDVLQAAVAAVQRERLLDEAREAAPRIFLGERRLGERDSSSNDSSRTASTRSARCGKWRYRVPTPTPA